MSNKHFIPPIIEQWIQNMNDPNSNEFVRGNYARYLKTTVDAINVALSKYENQNNNKIRVVK